MAPSKLSFGLLASTLASLAVLSHGQQTTAVISTLEPAAATVAADSDAGVDLFEVETVQLTDDVLAVLGETEGAAEYAHLFQFDNSTEISSLERRFGFSPSCKVLPGDAAWPGTLVWTLFNILTGFAVKPITPLASVCYRNSVFRNYNAAKCSKVVNDWYTEKIHYDDPSSIMFPLYQGMTCLPNENPTTDCTLGGYSSYAVEVRNVAQIQLAINFARLSNIRLVVKNTGHDYNGRSAGAGSLSLWTHKLKDIKFIKNHKTTGYTGPAFKVGAGVQVFEIYEAAHKNGVTVLGGICPTVGFTGGYLAGGGHSPLMQLHGMAADQILALEVVTADGRWVTATPTQNSDLYWALSGGGGGTFGVVTSIIVKAHPKIDVTTSRIIFSTSDTVTQDMFFEGVKAYWDLFLPFIDAGTYSYFWVSGFGGNFNFDMNPFWAPLHTVEEFNALVKPWFDRLTEIGIPFTAESTYHTNFLSAYDATFRPQDFNVGGWSFLPGVRLLPRENWEDEQLRNDTFAVIRSTVENYGMIGGYHQGPKNPSKIINSVNSHFRDEAAFLIVGSGTSENATPAEIAEASRALTYDVLGPLRDISPNGGSYANEADVAEPDWQESFWGDNYPRLLQLKKKFDPRGLFYVHHGVGSEDWEVLDGEQGVQTQNGRLCRA
ncbi:hypothetical protein AJ80_05678 [Polytolypa hystricis UAMH7299]|uniref:FAD-binding PCMH-type domain-containing protein n=1 Tax=Polytolypa hystricis (strain UAMH7299) TaxID=1447883 RepID=A0A2B7Y1X8_POLH7|nr:hypothetical protein AJ80_05678 [Polytolypa hystricis UAMH7299]